MTAHVEVNTVYFIFGCFAVVLWNFKVQSDCFSECLCILRHPLLKDLFSSTVQQQSSTNSEGTQPV